MNWLKRLFSSGKVKSVAPWPNPPVRKLTAADLVAAEYPSLSCFARGIIVSLKTDVDDWRWLDNDRPTRVYHVKDPGHDMELGATTFRCADITKEEGDAIFKVAMEVREQRAAKAKRDRMAPFEKLGCPEGTT